MMNKKVNEIEAAKCYVCESKKIKFHSEINGFTVVKCHQCGLLWAIDVNDEDIYSFYNKNYFQNRSKMGYENYLADEENHRRNARHLLNIVNSVKDLRNLRILDIGCAFGFLLDEAKKFKGCNAYGVEISGYAREYAQRQLRLANISEDQELCNFESNLFDVVFLIGTIEHLVSPKLTLDNIGRVLKQGGLLVITTLDTRGLIPLYSIKPPEHIFYFNHNNIMLLLGRMGYRGIIRRLYFVNYYLHDLYYRIGEFLSLSFITNTASIIKKFFNISVHIPTNEIIIVAKKL